MAEVLSPDVTSTDDALSALPPSLRTCAEDTMLGDVLALHARGVPLDPSSAAQLLFALRASDLTRGDRIALRRHILAHVAPERAALHGAKAARVGNPGPEHIVTLLLAGTAANPKAPPVVRSLAAAREALRDLLAEERALVAKLARRDPSRAAERMAALEPRIVEQRAIVDSFARWAETRFADQIARFRVEGRATDPEDAAKLLYALRRQRASESELAALRDALLDGRPESTWPKSAKVEPPTARSLFALMSGVEAPDTDAELSARIPKVDAARASALTAIRDGLVRMPLEVLAAPIAAFGETGRAVAPYYSAILAETIAAMRLERPQLDRLHEALIDVLRGAHSEVHATIRAARDTKALMRVLTGEILGRPPLPLDRAKLTALIAKARDERASAMEARLRLLDDRRPADLEADDQTRLAEIDDRLVTASTRLEELKDARAGVNAVRGHRWLDRLEVDVLAGGAVGIPGLFSGSVMGGASVDEADPTTGRRAKGLVGYAMPAFSVGGYGKLDISYSRNEGFGLSGGGGADFLGVWGGPGGESWGNVFAGGLWVPQVINAGVGYGVQGEEAYGAFILSTFWPPFSPASARVDTVVRHPSFAIGAQRGSELVRALAESRFIRGGKDLLTAAGQWIGGVTEPVFDPVQDALREIALRVRGRRAARGLSEADASTFLEVLRVLSAPSDANRRTAEDAEALLALHREDVRRVLPRLEALLASNPAHVETCFLASSAYHVLGEGRAAVDAAERGWHAAAATADPRDDENARAAYVRTAIAHGDLDRVWPTLDDWLGESTGLVPRLLLVDWLAARGRHDDAQQIAASLAEAHPRSFAAQRALARTIG